MIEFPIVVFFRPAWEVFSLKCLSGMNIVNFFINRGVLWCLRMEILSRFLHDAAMLKSVVVKSFFYTLFMGSSGQLGPSALVTRISSNDLEHPIETFI